MLGTNQFRFGIILPVVNMGVKLGLSLVMAEHRFRSLQNKVLGSVFRLKNRRLGTITQ
jgi:hypothetical protein